MADQLPMDRQLAEIAKKILDARTAYEKDHPGRTIPRGYEDQKVKELTNGLFGIGDLDTYLSKVVMPQSTGLKPQLRTVLNSLSLGSGGLLERALAPDQAARSRLQSSALEAAKPGPAFLEKALPAMIPFLMSGGAIGPQGAGILPALGRAATNAGIGGAMTAGDIATNAPGGQVPQQLKEGIPAMALGAAGGAGFSGLFDLAGYLGPKTGVLNPLQRAMSQMRDVHLPAIGAEGTAASGAAQIPLNAAAWAPPGKTLAKPTLAELMGPQGTDAFTSALADNPAAYGIARQSARIAGASPFNRGQTTVPDLEEGVRSATQVWSEPIYARMRAEHPDIQLGGSGKSLTIGEALTREPSSAEYRAAMKAAIETKGGFSKVNPDAPVPGFEQPGIGDVYDRPVIKAILDKAQTEQALGVRPEPGKPYSFAEVQRAIEVLKAKKDALWNSPTGDREVAKQLMKAITDIEAAVVRQVSEYAPTQAEYAVRSGIAKRAGEEGGKLVLGASPSSKKPPVTGIGSLLYRITYPIAKATVGRAHQNTQTQLARILSSSGEDIGPMLQRILGSGPKPISSGVPAMTPWELYLAQQGNK